MRRLLKPRPLPPHLAHLDPPYVVAQPPIGPLEEVAPICRGPITYYAGQHGSNRHFNAQFILAVSRHPRDDIWPIRSYTFRHHLEEALAMLRDGATEDEVLSFEHRT